MKLRHLFTWTHAIVVMGTLGLMGCGQSDGKQGGTEGATTQASAHSHSHDHDHDHSGWWCVEHGIPEEECGMCDSKLAAKYREKGDWCQDHQRPDSQCFICHPEKAEKYAALYEAKYGEKPPAPTE